jgi:hypothetical protein
VTKIQNQLLINEIKSANEAVPVAGAPTSEHGAGIVGSHRLPVVVSAVHVT